MGQIQLKDALLRQFLADDLDVVFGNPGSTEENFLQAVGDNSRIKYVLGLQEASVAAMADGWARVKRKPAICQIHSAVGLGNAMGVLYEASRSHTPMLMIAGEPPTELQAFDGFLAGDLVRIALPLTKYSTRLTHGSQALRVVRRALKVAMTPPYGPVFLAIPMDVLDEWIDESSVFPTTFVTPSAACSQADAEEIARRLVQAQMPMLLVGDGVAEASARDELTELAHLLAAPVWGVEFNELSMSFKDPLFMGLIGHSFGERTRSITLTADALLAIGTPVFPELFPSVQPYFQEKAVLMQIDRDPWEIAKNFPVHVGVQADPRTSLRLVIDAVKKLCPSAETVKKRFQKVEADRMQAFETERRNLEAVPDGAECMSAATLMRTLSEELPAEAMVYDEALTSTTALLHYLRPDQAGSYILARGGSIGVGWPGALGAAIAERGRTVVAPSGDGSALFALQTLWTAAHLGLKVIFIACNNGAYRILKINMLHYLKDNGEQPPEMFPHMDLEMPRIDFATLAAGFGMRAVRVKEAAGLRKALREAFLHEGPFLIDVLLNGSVDQEINQLFP